MMNENVDFERVIWSGSRFIDVLDPKPEDIVIEEVALNLAHETRFSRSATRVHWTVGQHSLFCFDLARQDGIRDPRMLLSVLLHDGPEYLLRDLYQPVKRRCQDYQEIEHIWWRAFADRFDLPRILPDIVKHYDWLAFSSEKAALLSSDSGPWPGTVSPRPIPDYLLDMTPEEAARRYGHWVEALESEMKQTVLA